MPHACAAVLHGVQPDLAPLCPPQYEEIQAQLSGLQERFEQTEQEKQSISDELQQCKVDLKLQQEKGSSVSGL